MTLITDNVAKSILNSFEGSIRRQYGKTDRGYQDLIGKPVLSQAEISELAHCWDRLDSEKIEDNVYYSRKYVQALLNNLPQKHNVKFAAAWQSEKLIGLLPVFLLPIWIPYFVPRGAAWTTLYTFSCLPILDKHDPVASARGVLKSLSDMRVADWSIRDFYLSGPTHSAFCNALDQEKVAWHSVPKYERAVFEAGHDFEQHIKEFVPRKRRRDLARNRKRFEKLGEVTHEVHTHGEGLEYAVDAFLDLEKSGWKGECGTALACNKETENFAREIFQPKATGAVRADLLLLDGIPVAAGMMVFDGGTAFTIKGAYNEVYSKYSVGLLLEMEVAESFLNGDWARKLDSATAGSHVIDFLWPERQAVGDLYFSFRPNMNASKFKNFEKLDQWKNNSKNKLKQLLHR
ncbi:MAG: GNAT family N-acetyltransferase [Rhizobiaceae bacterium]|nr:GNAT family N-acetyltransferase [Rhizobiaceae bacterium]